MIDDTAPPHAHFMSVAETAETLGISDDLVYALVDRGELPATSLGRRKLIPHRAIELLVERSLVGFDPDRLVAAVADRTPTVRR